MKSITIRPNVRYVNIVGKSCGKLLVYLPHCSESCAVDIRNSLGCRLTVVLSEKECSEKESVKLGSDTAASFHCVEGKWVNFGVTPVLTC